MLLVLSYSESDLFLAEALAKYLPHLGPYFDHDLMLAPAASVQDSVLGFKEILEPCFRKTYVYPVLAADMSWPLGCQRQFHAVGMHVFQAIPDVDNGWYYFEPDNCPTRVGWLDEISEEYKMCGRPFMGVTAKTVWQDLANKDRRIEDGFHLVGTAIYPRDLAHRSPLFRALRDVRTPFDVFMQHENTPQAHVTNLMFHEWQTKNYTRNKQTGVIIGELAREWRSWPPRVIPPQAAVVHGCKDLSLMNIYRGLLTGVKLDLSFVEEESKVQIPPLPAKRPRGRPRKVSILQA